ncbi:ATP synthase subunit B/b' [Bartonella bacilliformis str. Heidi Mejia]|uniref:F0F1 ATP synthase subunit B n=1 Tax=Bartonella bacilliformis TaxID=774 RepID=UPI00044A6E08|nr:F0F1 ATP synthase subunit B [Bartonella bacilliformis]EYS92332.1 ATP synthase subunit B/b' [Bartonella bacilliformis str. Heidi Mejia]EYS94928.1 ATP synthase subunit B/b' [Bartonella bacilliformis Peru-18]KEG17601.1 ATP synthase subunit B/b' [Bartonella bacilliformis CUSCO5]KEG18597.1 ATP synthase subunit B/b' [Bartonella bacilliformis Hosp800-02]KEG23705.1 ATP synthase subunit B/b' [Bartonella bacilliformis VAB9028]
MLVSNVYAQTSEALRERVENALEHADRVFPPFDFSHFCSHFFWLVISFGFFYFFIARVIVPRIGCTIEIRRDRIASDLDRAMRLKQEADTVVEIYERKLGEARLQAYAIAQKTSNEIKEKTKLERKEIETSLDKKLADAEGQIAKIRNKAVQNIGSIAEEVVPEIVKKLIGVEVSKESVSLAVKAADN